jgi:hypothetical protein
VEAAVEAGAEAAGVDGAADPVDPVDPVDAETLGLAGALGLDPLSAEAVGADVAGRFGADG